MKFTRLETNCWPACNADWAKPAAHSPIDVIRFDSAVPLRSGSCWNHWTALWIAFGMVCVKKDAMFWPRPVTNDTADCHAEARNDVNADHAWRPVSVWVKNQTSAATTAATSVMMTPMGFAARTALKALATAVPACVTAVHASWAFFAMLVEAASCVILPETPPMPLMALVTAPAAFLMLVAAEKTPLSPLLMAVMPAAAVLKPRNAVPMPMMAARISSPCSLAQFPTDCNADARVLTNGAAALNASPTSWPTDAAAPPLSPTAMNPVTASIRPWPSCVIPFHSSLSDARNDCTPPLSESVPMKMLTLRVAVVTILTSAEIMLFSPTRKPCIPPPSVMTASRLLPNACALAESPCMYMPSRPKSACHIDTSGLAVCAAWPSQFFTPVTMFAAASPTRPNWLKNPLIAPAMSSTPTASTTFCTALATRFCTFSMAVPMPWVASLACCANDAYWPKPLPLRRTTAALNSSNPYLPSFMASYRSFALCPAPIIASATWLSWPGMAACTLRHACMSTLPAAIICVSWASAFSCSIVLAPPASIALLNASAMLVASSRLLVNGASCWTMPVMAELVVGRPSSDALIFLIDAAASSLE